MTIDGNVLVAAPCRLDGTTVKGNVLLYAGGSLVAVGANIIGNIQAENADFVDVVDTDVNGDIQLDNLVGDASRVERSTVGGSIQLKGNRSRLEVFGNDVIGDVQAFSNVGGVVIADNVIDGNLQCKTNVPPPAGGNNRVAGNKEDQCANLAPESGGGPAPGGGGGSSTGSGSQQVASNGAGGSGSGGGGGMGPAAASLLLMLLMLRQLRRQRREVR
ncbi:MAG TPA: hypothetical protein VGA44_03505 [Steroidobacteraceae bacterium]